MGLVGGPRAGVGRLVGGASLVLLAGWAVLGVLLHRDGLGGQVLWFLPEWSVPSSGEFGGAVTTGQLHLAAARGSQALAVVAVLGLLAQAVPATGWLRLADAVWGRAARCWAPMLCLGEAYAAQQRELVAARRAGLGPLRAGEALTGLGDRARGMAEAWTAARPPRSSRTTPVRGLLGLVAAIGLLLWWAVGVVATGDPLDVSGVERTALALGGLLLVGVLLHGGGIPRPRPGDALPLGAGVVLAAAWAARGRTGESDDLVVTFAAAPPLPVVLLAAVAVLPMLALAAGGRR